MTPGLLQTPDAHAETAPIDRDFAVQVVRRLRSAGHQALFAGGCVRDQLLGLRPKDYDVATSALPAEVQRLFPRTLSIGANFGVIQVRDGRGLQVEVATFRADAEYLDGRRPASVRFTDAAEDARRRDFTINGMFFDPIEEKVIDYIGGREDLAARRIRAIGDPLQRFREDKLRLLRSVRFAARFNFELDYKTAAAVQAMASQLPVVSAERILMEIRLLLPPTHRRRSMELLRRNGLFPVVFPETAHATATDDAWNRTLDVIDFCREEISLPLAIASLFAEHSGANLCGDAELLMRRLKAPNEERDRCIWLVGHRSALRAASAARPYFLKRLFIQPGIDELLNYSAALGLGEDVAFCRRWLDQLSDEELNPPPLVTGDSLIEAGFAPGPFFKQWLDRIRDRQLDGGLNSREEALALVRQWAAENLRPARGRS